MSFINLYNLLLISSTASTKASESEGSKEEWPAWTIFEHTAPRPYSDMRYGGRFSTHSRPKAAGFVSPALAHALARFQHTAARRRLVLLRCVYSTKILVSTHSLPKAAGNNSFCSFIAIVFQHTAARRRLDGVGVVDLDDHAFQHTAARRRLGVSKIDELANQWFQHTAARRRLDLTGNQVKKPLQFQHTAARRRLADNRRNAVIFVWVSTHSRPKAAGSHA